MVDDVGELIDGELPLAVEQLQAAGLDRRVDGGFGDPGARRRGGQEDVRDGHVAVILELDAHAAGVADHGQFGESWHAGDPFEIGGDPGCRGGASRGLGKDAAIDICARHASVEALGERGAQLVSGELADGAVALRARTVQPPGDQPQLARPAELEVVKPASGAAVRR